jgi:hypothetical protein
MKSLNLCIPGFAILALLLTDVPAAYGTKYDTSPRPTRLLRKSDAFVVQDAWNSVACYSIRDGHVIHSFPAKQRVKKFAVSSDESFLIVGCDDGAVALWKLDSSPTERRGGAGPVRDPQP